MKNYLPLILLIILALMVCGDLFAGRIANISAGVSGSDYQKMKQLKNLAFGAGLFITPVGILLFINRKKLMIHIAIPVIALLIGIALVLTKFV